MYEAILEHIAKYTTLSDNEQLAFTKMLDYKAVPKKTTLLRPGEICRFEGYIVKGCVRVYAMNENGCEVTLCFAVEDWWVCDIDSFYEQKPSNFFMETLEETELLVFTREAKEKLLRTVPKFERLFRNLVQRNLCALQNRLVGTILKPATERYLDFIEMYPSLSLRVPQYYIASFLGVSPEFISTIRKRLSTKQKNLLC